MTLYEKTIEFVRRLIVDRDLQPGDRLPSETEIAATCGVSLMTVRRAMGELAAAGVLNRIQGKGTFVRSMRIEADSTILGGLRDTLADQGVSLETHLLSLSEQPADEALAKSLAVPVGSAIWRVLRVRLLDQTPAVREVAFIPRILAPDLDVRFTESDSLYELLATHYGLSESIEEQTLIARPANGLEAGDLSLSAGDFVVEITGVSSTLGGTAFDRFEMVFVPSLFAFRLSSSPTADPVRS